MSTAFVFFLPGWQKGSPDAHIESSVNLDPNGNETMRSVSTSMQEIIESQTGSPCDCAPTLDAYEASNLVMDLVTCATSADV
jgi:hypothetical protein